jgi:hypothetical protein
MVAADANDGMEYPMITMDGGRDPGYRGLLVHEIAHNWFYGMVGSNETYRAALDEGFTQFLTADGLEQINGDTLIEDVPKGWIRRHFTEPRLSRDVRVYNTYIADAATGQDFQLNTHSDDFNGALGHGGGYRLVYYKTATMLYNLQYVLGDSLFQGAMQHYFQQWKFAHPYFEDFRNSIIQYTKVDLNWFFDQWLETTKGLNYGICGIKKVRGTDSFDISIMRKGEMQMPVDFTVTTKTGSKQSYHIPNTWFEKTTAAAVLPRWTGWGMLNKKYSARISVPEGIKHVQIDTSNRLADKMMLDNYRTRGALISPKKIITRWDAGLIRLWTGSTTVYISGRMYGIMLLMVSKPVSTLKSLPQYFPGCKRNGMVEQPSGPMEYVQNINGANGYSRYAPINYTLNVSTPFSLQLPQLKFFANSSFLDGLWYHGRADYGT